MMDKGKVRGNTVLKANETQKIAEENHKKFLKEQKELLNKNRKKVLMKKLKVIRNISIVFTISMVLVARFAVICNLRQEVINTQKEITKTTKENENLRVELLRYDNIQYIEKVAIEKLKMEKATLSNAVYCNLENKYVKNTTMDKNLQEQKKNSIMGFLKSKLF